MQEVNCYIPIKLQITGRPSDSQLDDLGETLLRALKARIALAEETVAPHDSQFERVIVEEPAERADPLRLRGSEYEVPAYDTGGSRRRVPIQSILSQTPTDLPYEEDYLYYAFYFTNDNYGRAARDFIRTFYPDHRSFRARSFEQMFRILLRDVRRHIRRTRRRPYIREIVLVTHAIAAGRIFVPLTERRPRRTFSPSDLADLQQSFRSGLHSRFRQTRRTVAAVLDENTTVVVRGCNVGQSQEALDALRVFFGGQVRVFAPTRYQHFRGMRISRDFASLEEAFDFLVENGYLPEDQLELPAEQKRRYIRETFGSWIPSEAFITTEDEAEWIKALGNRRITQEQRERLEEILVRPAEASPLLPGVPSAGEFWGYSGPTAVGSLVEASSLSVTELIALIRQLLRPYRPENARRIIGLLNTLFWDHLSELIQSGLIDDNDPLAGLTDPNLYPNLFGDAPSWDTLLEDANRQPYDPFEEETLPQEEISAEQEAEEARQLRVVQGLAAATVPGRTREADFTSRGQVEELSNGVRLWNFGVDSARIRPQFRGPLTELAQQAAANPNTQILVEGHTSRSGGINSNQTLSDERTIAVRDFLIEAGISTTRIDARGFGEQSPYTGERDRNGNLIPRRAAMNRRVDVRLVAGPGTTTPPSAEAEIIEETLRRSRESTQRLGREGRRSQEEGSDAVSAGLTVAEITATIVGEVAGVLELFVLQLAGSIGAWVFSVVGLVITLNDAMNAQIRASRRLGIELGINAAFLLRDEQLENTVTANQLEFIVKHHWQTSPEWFSQIRYSYPLGPDNVRDQMRQSLERIAQGINRAMRWGEEELRQRLRNIGLSPQEAESIYNVQIVNLRRQLLEALVQAISREMRRQRQ